MIKENNIDSNNYLLEENEKPLDIIKSYGGFTSIFRTIDCIGESLSSGEFQFKNDEGYWVFMIGTTLLGSGS